MLNFYLIAYQKYPKFNTTWLKQVAAAPSREYDVKQDFDKLVKECRKWHSPEVAQEIDELFKEAYEAFNRVRKSL